MDMYFIALVAPEKINADVLKWKTWFRDHYGCGVALKSPAHITLIPPFRMQEALEPALKNRLEVFAGLYENFEVTFCNFSHFKPRVIYVDVCKNEKLDILHREINEAISSENKYPVKKENRAFHPHITLATRDLKKSAFYDAWNFFAEKKYNAKWMVDSLSLLRHNKKNWDVIFTSRFRQQAL